MNMPPCPVLDEIFARRVVEDADGVQIKLHSNISREYAAALYNTVKIYKPVQCIEIGMCLGISTLSILTALRENNNGGKLISIDPLQTDPKHEKGIGLLNVRRAGLEALHTLIEKKSHEALPFLLADGFRADFAYIDGWHGFEYALLDFFYLDKMLKEGGIVGFNDCGWRSVHKVIKFVQRYRHYEEMDVGIRHTYQGANPVFTFIKRLEGRISNDRYFRKLDDWEPEGGYFRRF